MGRHDPTETSPLLSKTAAPDTTDAAECTSPSTSPTNGHDISGVKPADDGERQHDAGKLAAQQYEGMPEVKAKLKYILPAIGIGVSDFLKETDAWTDISQIFLAAADQTIIVACYGKIGSDLNALNNTSWISTGYFITLTSFQPLYGKMSDIFGRKSALLFGYAIFGLGCLFCGLARNMNELVAARAFAGIGGGGMTTVVSILMSDIVSHRERGTWQGIINIIYASGAGCGAPLGKRFSNPGRRAFTNCL